MIKLNTFDRSPRLAEFKVSYKRRIPSPEGPGSNRSAFTGPKSAEDYLRSIWNPDTLDLIEDFIVICLNGSHQPLGWCRVSSGGLNGTNVDPKVIFAIALQTASSAIIVAHNHPSGGLTPSEADIKTTKQLKHAADLLNIRFLDHVILTKESAFSFSANGLL